MMRKAFERRQHLNWTIREGLSVLRQSFGHIQLSCYASWVQTHPSMPAWPSLPTAMEMGSFMVFLCQLEGIMLSLVSSGCWRNTAKGKGFSFLGPRCLLNSCSSVLWPAARSSQQRPQQPPRVIS